MITCKKCFQLIGDSVEKCPFCKTPINNSDRIRQKEREAELAREEYEAMEEFRRRTTRGYILIAVYMLFFILFVVFTPTLMASNAEIVPICAIFSLIVLLFVIYKVRFIHCPYCERMMGRHFFSDYCNRCGRRLR